MSAEAIAKVVRDLRMGNVYDPRDDAPGDTLNKDTALLTKWATVVDSTAIWDRWMSSEQGGQIYEDHRICPPWQNALICYVNGFENVTVMSARTIDLTSKEENDRIDPKVIEYWDSLADTHVIEWDRVRWVMHVVVYMGGRGGGEYVRTQGPLHLWRVAIYPDGEIADLNWIQVRPDLDATLWDTAMMVMLDTFNMCNCVNVQVAEPTRSRPVARRLSRTGVTVNEIHIKPVSRSYRGMGVPLSQVPSSPLSSVRGHFSEYGPKYGKGLLFGKIEGRFWIPQHLRGDDSFGVVEQEYVTKP
jgi:hypothetical protein